MEIDIDYRIKNKRERTFCVRRVNDIGSLWIQTLAERQTKEVTKY